MIFAAALVLVSSAFPPGGAIPVSASCSGAGRSPALAWSHVPTGTRAFALVVDDPDARGNDGRIFVHWLGWNIPGGTRRLSTGEHAPREGQNSFGRQGYSGPCPPAGTTHHYRFRLYALNAPLQPAAGASRDQLTKALRGHVRASALLVGVFRSRK
jgi:Raf kinase inhibitor-like YbhB/YbcL family protein